jgi:hypothetical protein
MPKRLTAIGAIMATLLLAACNFPSLDSSTPPPDPQPMGPPPPPQAAQPAPAPAAFANLPPGAACTDKIHRYQTVLDADRATGNVEPPVYEAIEGEISHAADACAAGHDREALKLLRASAEKHGYHV